MRISIRRCLSMLRNTSDGNELAVPATNALQRCIVPVTGIVRKVGYSRGASSGSRRCAHQAGTSTPPLLLVLSTY